MRSVPSAGRPWRGAGERGNPCLQRRLRPAAVAVRLVAALLPAADFDFAARAGFLVALVFRVAAGLRLAEAGDLLFAATFAVLVPVLVPVWAAVFRAAVRAEPAVDRFTLWVALWVALCGEDFFLAAAVLVLLAPPFAAVRRPVALEVVVDRFPAWLFAV